MIKPLWALAGVAFLGITCGMGVLIASSGGEEGIVQQGTTSEPAPSASGEGSPSPAANSEAQITVTPGSGPVGTVVVLEGNGCAYGGAPTILVFQNGEETGRATIGAEAVSYDVPTDDQGHFRIAYTIPQEFDNGSLQGRGGGSLSPGLYQFISKPPICFTTFTVAN